MHTVRFSRSGEQCSAKDGQTILSVADENKVAFTRGCTNGACNLCMCKIREGFEDVMNKRSKKPFRSSEKVLACLAEIHGDIEVEISQKLESSSAPLPE